MNEGARKREEKSMTGSGLCVTSELGRLREVMVHTPGRELERVTPRNFGRMLMEDILYLKAAREDHLAMVRVLEHAGVRVHQVRDLLLEMLLSLTEEERRQFVEHISEAEGCIPSYKARLHTLSPEGLTEVCIEGELQEESLTRFLRHDLYALPPIANMMFVRDGAVVVNRDIILAEMSHSVRAREAALYEWVFRRHPLFRRNGVAPWLWLGKAEGRRHPYFTLRGTTAIPHLALEGANFRLRGSKSLKVGNQGFSGQDALIESDDVLIEAENLQLSGGYRFVLEGGNIFVLAEDTLLVGCNARTSPGAVDALAQEMLRRRSRVKTILVAVSTLDTFRTAHLDTGFALLDVDEGGVEWLAYEPMIEPSGANLTVVRMTFERGSLRVEPLPNLLTALEQLFQRKAYVPIYCGSQQRGNAKERIMQEREWHHQAVNVLTLGPGKLLAFQRNLKTLELLEERGYERIDAEDFLRWGAEEVQQWWERRKSVIYLQDNELSRAHGGPRSLVLPLRRDPFRA